MIVVILPHDSRPTCRRSIENPDNGQERIGAAGGRPCWTGRCSARHAVRLQPRKLHLSRLTSEVRAPKRVNGSSVPRHQPEGYSIVRVCCLTPLAGPDHPSRRPGFSAARCHVGVSPWMSCMLGHMQTSSPSQWKSARWADEPTLHGAPAGKGSVKRKWFTALHPPSSTFTSCHERIERQLSL
jgi:hypothetical protein